MRRLTVLGSLLWLLPQAAAADVRADPAEVAITTGVFWMVLGAGLLALWAAVAVVWRLLRGTKTPLLRPRPLKILAAVIVLGWIVSAAVLLAPRSRPRRGFAQAVGDVRTMISAQAAYHTLNDGLFEGDPGCLGTPSRCLPGYAANGPRFLDPSLAAVRVDAWGYRREFHKGAPADAQALRSGKVSPSSVASWAYTAVPIGPGETGVEAYCGDSSGIVCRTTDGSAPSVKDGACVLGRCEVLR